MHVTHSDLLLPWMQPFLPRGRRDGSVTATFVIDSEGGLRIADRHSEHVACAAGNPVQAAGEICFERSGSEVMVSEVSNQSTGYCPEPDCWTAVARALDLLGLSRPAFFTAAFHFRRCDRCGSTNLIKDDFFYCLVCDAPLNPVWNYGTVS